MNAQKSPVYPYYVLFVVSGRLMESDRVRL